MAKQHTPGPWETENDGYGNTWTVVGQDDGIDEYSGVVVFSDCAVNGEANARLIAAAPDLLVALQGILAGPYGCPFCDSGKLRNPDKGHTSDCPYEVARAAIAKARPDAP